MEQSKLNPRTQSRIAPNHQIVSLQISESLTESLEPPKSNPMAATPTYGGVLEREGKREDAQVESGNSSILASTSDVVVTFVQLPDGSRSYHATSLTTAGESPDTCFPLIVQDLSEVILKMKKEATKDAVERRQLQAEIHMLRQKVETLQSKLNGQFAAHRRAQDSQASGSGRARRRDGDREPSSRHRRRRMDEEGASSTTTMTTDEPSVFTE